MERLSLSTSYGTKKMKINRLRSKRKTAFTLFSTQLKTINYARKQESVTCNKEKNILKRNILRNNRDNGINKQKNKYHKLLKKLNETMNTLGEKRI